VRQAVDELAATHFCFARGMLVGARHWVPADPCEFAPGDSILPAVGCNRLRCTDCGAFVRNLPGLGRATGASLDPVALFESSAPAQLAGVVPDTLVRLYVCRCRLHGEHVTRLLETDDALRGVGLPWACAGHPAARFPLRLDGALIDPAPPLDDLVDDLLCARIPAALHPAIRDLAGFQAVRIHRLLDAAETRHALADGVADRLTHPDPLRRRGALGFYRLVPLARGAETVIALRHRRSLWSVADPCDPQIALRQTLRLAIDAIERARLHDSPAGRYKGGEPDPRSTTEAAAMSEHRIFSMPFSKVYPMYVQKAERKGRTREEVDQAICWLTGHDHASLQRELENHTDFRTFFAEAPAYHPSSERITGVVCGVRVENVDDPLMKQIRQLDKLIDEIAKGKSMEKVLRK